MTDARHCVSRVWPCDYRMLYWRPRRIHLSRPSGRRCHPHARWHLRHHSPRRLSRVFHHRGFTHLLRFRYCGQQSRQYCPRSLLLAHSLVGETGLADHPYGPACSWIAGCMLVYQARRTAAICRGKFCASHASHGLRTNIDSAIHRRHVQLVQRLGYLRRLDLAQSQLFRC